MVTENGNVVHLTDKNFEEEVLTSTVPVLVDFWAPWCGPCRIVAPILEELAEAYEERVKIAKLNVDEGQEWAARYGIQGMPTLILFKGGLPLGRIVGAAPTGALKAFVEKAL